MQCFISIYLASRKGQKGLLQDELLLGNSVSLGGKGIFELFNNFFLLETSSYCMMTSTKICTSCCSLLFMVKIVRCRIFLKKRKSELRPRLSAIFFAYFLFVTANYNSVLKRFFSNFLFQFCISFLSKEIISLFIQ